MYSSCSCISLSITLCSLWSVYNEQSLAHISSELINMDVLSTESAGPLSLEKHMHYDMWLTASVSMLQLSNLTFTRRACARFDINNAKNHWSLCPVPNPPNMNMCLNKRIHSSTIQVLFWYSLHTISLDYYFIYYQYLWIFELAYTVLILILKCIICMCFCHFYQFLYIFLKRLNFFAQFKF